MGRPSAAHQFESVESWVRVVQDDDVGTARAEHLVDMGRLARVTGRRRAGRLQDDGLQPGADQWMCCANEHPEFLGAGGGPLERWAGFFPALRP